MTYYMVLLLPGAEDDALQIALAFQIYLYHLLSKTEVCSLILCWQSLISMEDIWIWSNMGKFLRPHRNLFYEFIFSLFSSTEYLAGI